MGSLLFVMFINALAVQQGLERCPSTHMTPSKQFRKITNEEEWQKLQAVIHQVQNGLKSGEVAIPNAQLVLWQEKKKEEVHDGGN